MVGTGLADIPGVKGQKARYPVSGVAGISVGIFLNLSLLGKESLEPVPFAKRRPFPICLMDSRKWLAGIDQAIFACRCPRTAKRTGISDARVAQW